MGGIRRSPSTCRCFTPHSAAPCALLCAWLKRPRLPWHRPRSRGWRQTTTAAPQSLHVRGQLAHQGCPGQRDAIPDHGIGGAADAEPPTRPAKPPMWSTERPVSSAAPCVARAGGGAETARSVKMTVFAEYVCHSRIWRTKVKSSREFTTLYARRRE